MNTLSDSVNRGIEVAGLLWLGLMVGTAYVFILAPVRVAEGNVDRRLDYVVGAFGVLFWIGAVMVFSQAVSGI